MIELNTNYAMTINGSLVTTENTLPVINPATKMEIARVPVCSKGQLDETVAAARQALKTWSRTSIETRQAVVSELGRRLESKAEDFMTLLTREQGKPRAGAEWEILGAAGWLKEIATQVLPEELVEETETHKVITRYTPLGVVGAIVPWNFPLLLAVWKIAPALVAGCTVVLKPSPYTPLCDLKFVEMAKDILPAGVLNCVSGTDDLGRWMTIHPDINKIAFTGSTETGRHVVRAAADTVKRVTLELGGNDPAIVLPDIDPQAIAPQLFWACFQNNAQFCNAAKRLYIHETVYDEVRDALVEFIKNEVKVGDGAESDTTLGPIQNLEQYNKVKEYFDDCKKHGYKFAVGGEIDDNAPGWFIPVTLVDNPPENSRLVREEPFGPILPLLKWDDEQEVIYRANDTIYGLGASVWGRDMQIVQRIGEQIEAGTVWLNEVHTYSPHQAFGGHKQSGIGCENSLHGLKEYTNWQTIAMNKDSI